VSATSNRNSQQSGQNERSKAHGFISLGVLCIATGPIFVKLISGPGSLIAFYRLFFAALLLTPLAIIRQHRQPLVAMLLGMVILKEISTPFRRLAPSFV